MYGTVLLALLIIWCAIISKCVTLMNYKFCKVT